MSKILSGSNTCQFSNDVVVAPSELSPTVLVVDDDRRFAQAVSDAFLASGFKTLIANDGNAAVAVAVTKRPDFMILDSRMPRRSGYLVLEYLAVEFDHFIPTVMLSENEGKRHQEYARMLGALDFIAKPINTVEILSVVFKLMRNGANNVTT
jgi:DNA-binding response OmpR family regulator